MEMSLCLVIRAQTADLGIPLRQRDRLLRLSLAATSGPSTQSDIGGNVEMLDAATTPNAAHTPSAPSVGGNVAYPTFPPLSESSSGLSGA